MELFSQGVYQGSIFLLFPETCSLRNRLRNWQVKKFNISKIFSLVHIPSIQTLQISLIPFQCFHVCLSHRCSGFKLFFSPAASAVILLLLSLSQSHTLLRPQCLVCVWVFPWTNTAMALRERQAREIGVAEASSPCSPPPAFSVLLEPGACTLCFPSTFLHHPWAFPATFCFCKGSGRALQSATLTHLEQLLPQRERLPVPFLVSKTITDLYSSHRVQFIAPCTSTNARRQSMFLILIV